MFVDHTSSGIRRGGLRTSSDVSGDAQDIRGAGIGSVVREDLLLTGLLLLRS
jgi:hypothetical protein